jgi:serine/threonine-protein kinase
MDLQPGLLVDNKYRVVRKLGEGGMGAVYEGENVRIRRRVAMKVLHADLAGNPLLVARFQREAQAAARIGSSHIVDVLDMGDLPSGEHYLVMEYLEGESLGSRLARRGRFTPEELFLLVRQLLEGLGRAHAAGIIHRDLKPDNVFITYDDKDGSEFVKILDFGISKFRELDETNQAMTRTGTVIGTPFYMSPEQARGDVDIDQRADIYAVGVMLYHGLSGTVPFEAASFNQLMFRIALDDAVPLLERCPQLDPGAAAIVASAMAREREDRHASARVLDAALVEWLQAHGIAADPRLAADTRAELPTRLLDAGSVPSVVPFDVPSSAETTRREGAQAMPAASVPPGFNTQLASASAVTSIPPRSRAPVVALVAALGAAVIVAGWFVSTHLDTGPSATTPSAADPSAPAAPPPEPEVSAPPSAAPSATPPTPSATTSALAPPPPPSTHVSGLPTQPRTSFTPPPPTPAPSVSGRRHTRSLDD